ncbi:MAG: GNAT family N-acetyltransferase [Oscillospiraceae bacterium]|nr:GNAT family N-acetyltransferase [Oscillospiraceae bacterium]
MKIDFYKNNPVGFWNDTINILCENEAQNSIIIRNAMKFKNGEGADDWYCATVKDNNGGIIITAMCTPPWNVAIYGTGNNYNEEAVNFLVKELHNESCALHGVTGEKVLAGIFAEIYAKLTGKSSRVHVTLNAMQLDKLSDVNFAPGYLREITEDDLYFMPYWQKAFSEDCNLGSGNIAEIAENQKNQIGKNMLYIWSDKIPVSMAGLGHQRTNSAHIGRVYTPPFYRNKNYSTSCVWYLSKILLDRGNKFVSLFADADYPVSNKVYQKIGYRNVCLYQEIKFE